MNMTPKITLFASAARPHYWIEYYESIGTNTIPFEIVFVGPSPPNFKLPDNFKFIQSYTKPTQCFEIARRHAVTDLVMNVSDDCVFNIDHPLDVLYDTYMSLNNDKAIVSCRYMMNGDDMRAVHLFFVKDPASPVMPMHSLMSQQLYRNVGGIDKNFIAVMWDLDVAMRVYAFGGTVVISDVFSDEVKARNSGHNLCGEYWFPDRSLLERLWSVGGKTHFNRSMPFEPFSDYRIIEKTQGPKGKW